MSGTIADWERDRFHRETADELAELPETQEPLVGTLVAPDLGNDPITLCSRSTGGWSVELRLVKSEAEGKPHDRCVIVAQRGEDAPLETVFVALDKALDAFNHPFCYLPR